MQMHVSVPQLVISGSANVLKAHAANMRASVFWVMDDLCPTFEDHYTTSKYQAQPLQ